jgi:flavorubredoxin
VDTRIYEIADRIYRLSTFAPDVGPTGFTFNQFLIDADEPALVNTGSSAMFPMVSEAGASLVPLDRLRSIMFGSPERDTGRSDDGRRERQQTARDRSATSHPITAHQRRRP